MPAIVRVSPPDARPAYAHNMLHVSGRAFGPERIVAMAVEVDGETFAAELSWPDSEGDGVAFRAEIPAERWSGRRLPVRISARDAAGRSVTSTGDVAFVAYEDAVPLLTDPQAAISSGRTLMWCEVPWLDGSARLAGGLTLTGWAWCAEGIVGVRVYLDGRRCVSAFHGLSRAHLRGSLGSAVAATGGWTVTLDPSELSPGEHTVTVIAEGRDGRRVGTSGSVVCLAPGDEALATLGGPPEPEVAAAAGAGLDFERDTAAAADAEARYRWVALLARGRRVLDCPCGAGFGTAVLAASGAAGVVAVDLSEIARERTRNRVGANADVRSGEPSALPAGDGEFGLVVCFGGLIGREAAPVIAELTRVLAPDGVLVVSLPRGENAMGPPELAAALRQRLPEVALHRQHMHVASLIADAETFAATDPGRDLPVTVRKLVGGAPGEEQVTLAVASRVALPELPAFLVAGSGLDLAAQIEQTEAWRERAIVAEALAATERVDANLAQATQAILAKELEEVRARLAELSGPSDGGTRPAPKSA